MVVCLQRAKYEDNIMCKLCDEIRPKEWNFCPICGREINIPRYSPDETFRDLLERAVIEREAVLEYLKDK